MCLSFALFSVRHSPTLKHTVDLFFFLVALSALCVRVKLRYCCCYCYLFTIFFLFSAPRSNNVTANKVRWCVHAQHIRSPLICTYVFVYKFENALPFKMLERCFGLGHCYYCCCFVLLMRLRTSTHLRTLVHAHTILYGRTRHTIMEQKYYTTHSLTHTQQTVAQPYI